MILYLLSFLCAAINIYPKPFQQPNQLVYANPILEATLGNPIVQTITHSQIVQIAALVPRIAAQIPISFYEAWTQKRQNALIQKTMKDNPPLKFENGMIDMIYHDPESTKSPLEQYLDLCKKNRKLAYVELEQHEYQRRQTVLFDAAAFMAAKRLNEEHGFSFEDAPKTCPIWIGFSLRDEHPSKNFPKQIHALLMDPNNNLLIAAAYRQIIKAGKNNEILNLGQHGFVKCIRCAVIATRICTPIYPLEIYQEKISTGEISVRQCYQDHLPWSKRKHLNKMLTPTI